MKANISDENKEKLKCFSGKCKKEKEENEKALWLQNKMNFQIDFNNTLEKEQERFNEYYLLSIKEILENGNIELSNKVLANAIKNGLTIKYPELKSSIGGLSAK